MLASQILDSLASQILDWLTSWCAAAVQFWPVWTTLVGAVHTNTDMKHIDVELETNSDLLPHERPLLFSCSPSSRSPPQGGGKGRGRLSVRLLPWWIALTQELHFLKQAPGQPGCDLWPAVGGDRCLSSDGRDDRLWPYFCFLWSSVKLKNNLIYWWIFFCHINFKKTNYSGLLFDFNSGIKFRE